MIDPATMNRRVLDTSGRRSAQAELQEREAELRATQRVARLGSWYQEHDAGSVRWSEEMSTIFGIVPPIFDLAVDDLRPLFTAESFAKLAAAAASTRETGQPYELEAEIIRADGSAGWVMTRGEPVWNAHGDVIAARGTVLDITERKKAEAASAELSARTELRERMLSTLLSSMNDFAYIYDRDGRFVFVNQPLLDLWGIPLEAAIGKNFAELGYPEELAKKLQREISEVFETKTVLTGETPYVSPTGVDGTYEYIFSPVMGVDGAVDFVVGSTRDITQRKRTEDELRASYEKFQQIAENITDVVWIRSPDMSELHFISPAFERIWGRSVESLRSNPALWTESFAAEDRERVGAAFDSLQHEAPSIDIEYRIVRPDGEIRWIRKRAFQVRDERGVHIRNIGFGTDITEKRAAEDELRASNEKFQQIAANVNDVFWIRSPDMSELFFLSPGFERVWGRPVQSLLASPASWTEFIAPDDCDYVIAAFNGLQHDVPAIDIKYRIVRPDGDLRWIRARGFQVRDDPGMHIRNIGVATDITEEHAAQEALRQSQKRLRDVFDGLGPSVFVALLTADGVLVDVNRSPLEAAGLRAEDVLGLPFDETHWWTYSPDVQRQLREAIARARAGQSSRYDVRTRGAGDEVIDIDFALEPLRETSGDIRFIIASASVITERKIAEEALRQAQKMEAVGQLAAGVAHEFNNLLQALMSTSAIMRYQAPTPAIARTGADLEALIKRGGALTQQLLLFARSNTIETSGVDLGDELRAATTFLRALMPETVALVVEVPPEPLSVEADAGQIQQVLLNLAINARDAMPSGGTLTLRAGRVGDEVFQEVEDTGYGMSDETRAHLFEPFFSTKKPEKGTGLGLAVAHGIIKRHGGRFEVHSAPAQGSRFRLLLPRSGSPADRAPETTAEVDVIAGAGRVLVVEDDVSVREGIATLLESMGYEVVAAASGEEALALTLDPPPQFLLSDVTLPGLPGPRVATLLRERWPDVKIVLMSGYFEESVQRNARRDGWYFLQKPFEFDALARVLVMARTMGDSQPAPSASAHPLPAP